MTEERQEYQGPPIPPSPGREALVLALLRQGPLTQPDLLKATGGTNWRLAANIYSLRKKRWPIVAVKVSLVRGDGRRAPVYLARYFLTVSDGQGHFTTGGDAHE